MERYNITEQLMIPHAGDCICDPCRKLRHDLAVHLLSRGGAFRVRVRVPEAVGWRSGQVVAPLSEAQNLCLAPLIDRTLALIEKRCLPQEAPKATKPSLPSRATSQHRMQIGLRAL